MASEIENAIVEDVLGTNSQRDKNSATPLPESVGTRANEASATEGATPATQIENQLKPKRTSNAGKSKSR